MRAWGRRRDRGFTAIEVLVVLSIVALLGTLVAVVFRRHVVGKRVAEATSMLSELASKEEAYRAGGGRFVALRADGERGLPSRDEVPPRSIRRPATACSWRRRGRRRGRRRDAVAAGVADDRRRPRSELSYCTYLVNAGERGRPDPSLRFGSALLTTDSDGPWYYALAVCNLEGHATTPTA